MESRLQLPLIFSPSSKMCALLQMLSNLGLAVSRMKLFARRCCGLIYCRPYQAHHKPGSKLVRRSRGARILPWQMRGDKSSTINKNLKSVPCNESVSSRLKRTAARMSGEDVPSPAGWLPILGHWFVIKKYMKEKQHWSHLMWLNGAVKSSPWVQMFQKLCLIHGRSLRALAGQSEIAAWTVGHGRAGEAEFGHLRPNWRLKALVIIHVVFLLSAFCGQTFLWGLQRASHAQSKKLFPPLDDSCYLRRTFRIEDMSSTQNRRGRWHGQSHPKHSEILDDVGVEVVKQIFESFMCLWLQGLELNSWLWVILSWRRKFAVVILWGAESWTNML